MVKSKNKIKTIEEEILNVLNTSTYEDFDKDVLTPYICGDDYAKTKKEILEEIGSIFRPVIKFKQEKEELETRNKIIEIVNKILIDGYVEEAREEVKKLVEKMNEEE